jgi:dTDP-D-glucose 4,6-dehydratase
VINHADALRFLLTQPASLWPEQRPDRWNIAGPEITCEQMIFYIADLLNVDVNNIKYVESDLARPGHEARYALDTSKITQTGWEPPVEFKDALSSTVFGLATKARLT